MLNLCHTLETNVICQLHLNKKKMNKSHEWLPPFLVRADIPKGVSSSVELNTF